jgi:hypothetical protein
MTPAGHLRALGCLAAQFTGQDVVGLPVSFSMSVG